MKTESDNFGVTAQHMIGRSPAERGVGTTVKNDVEFTITNDTHTEVLVHVHYRSTYDFEYRLCTLKLAGLDHAKNFEKAKMFASFVTSLRGPLFSHPNVTASMDLHLPGSASLRMPNLRGGMKSALAPSAVMNYRKYCYWFCCPCCACCCKYPF
jgi:hypothetical protein